MQRRDALAAALARLAPVLLLTSLGLAIAAVLASSGSTIGYDAAAYLQAAARALAGERLYDPAVDVARGYGVYLYPPTFVVVAIPFTLLPAPLDVAAWIACLLACFLGGTALLPVRRPVRWAIVGLAALCVPFLYAVKLGQVGPILYLLFAIGWRSLDRPIALGLSTAAGTLVKLQPAVLFAWMLLTRRWAALAVGLAAVGTAAVLATLWLGVSTWADYLDLLLRVSKPVTTPGNMTPGAIAWRAGLALEAATALQYASMAAVAAVALFAWLRRDAAAGFVVGVVASQLLGPVLWDHYAMLLLLPTALLLERRQWWAVAIPVLPLLGTDLVYPLSFGLGLLGPILAPARRRDW